MGHMGFPVTRAQWYNYGAMLFTVLALWVATIWWVVHLVDETERKFCTVAFEFGEAYREEPPTTPTGKRVALAVDTLRHELGCPPPGRKQE